MTNEEFEAFKKAWEDSQSWDMGAEGPSAKDRGSFKAGWFAALEWEKKQKSDFAYMDHYEIHKYHVSIIDNLRNKVKEVDSDLLKMAIEDYQGEGAVKVIAALRKKEMTDRQGLNNAPYADWLFKNLEEILK
jgi:hypothetical protein